jgi:hypothetical protein
MRPDLQNWKDYSQLVYEAFRSTPSIDEMRDRIATANINSQSLLATDYLNHFNEVAMIVEMLPDMPDFIEDVKSWSPKSYKEHFRDSSFSDKDLAIAAYDCVPTPYLVAFEGAMFRAVKTIRESIAQLETAISTADRERIQIASGELSAKLEALMSIMRSIVNGELGTLAQGEIDQLLSTVSDPAPEPLVAEPTKRAGENDEAGGLDQDSIDSLFD